MHTRTASVLLSALCLTASACQKEETREVNAQIDKDKLETAAIGLAASLSSRGSDELSADASAGLSEISLMFNDIVAYSARDEDAKTFKRASDSIKAAIAARDKDSEGCGCTDNKCDFGNCEFGGGLEFNGSLEAGDDFIKGYLETKLDDGQSKFDYRISVDLRYGDNTLDGSLENTGSAISKIGGQETKIVWESSVVFDNLKYDLATDKVSGKVTAECYLEAKDRLDEPLFGSATIEFDE